MDDPDDEVVTPDALEILRSIQTSQQKIKARCERNIERTEAAIAKIEKMISGDDEEERDDTFAAA